MPFFYGSIGVDSPSTMEGARMDLVQLAQLRLLHRRADLVQQGDRGFVGPVKQ